ncbi:hypothetical protein MN608_05239 [Microdochium nivale]|nr:hypothetical protein MN608_05239 [Microdochium nivale]
MRQRVKMTCAASYAREQGLTVCYTQKSAPILGDLSDYLAKGMSLITDCDNSLDDSGLPLVEVAHSKCLEPASERLEISRDALDLLNQALALGREACPVLPTCSHRPPSFLAATKLELPLLSSDHEHDVRQLLWSCHKKRTPAFTPDSFPLERLDVDKDQGLDFPADSRVLHGNLNLSIKMEKFDVERDSMKWLAQSLSWDMPTTNPLEEDNLPLQGFTRCSMTPPLMPLLEHGDPYIPDAEVCQVYFTSDPETLIETDLHTAEANILDGDAIIQDGLDEAPEGRFLLSSPTSTELGVSTHHKARHSKRIESPLLDHSQSTAPTTSASLNLLRDCATEILSRPGQNLRHSADLDDSFLVEDIFDESCRESFEQFGLSLQCERLDAADTTARIAVPIMDFSIPGLEWQLRPESSQGHFCRLRKELSNATKAPTMPRRARTHSQLRWIPFSSTEGKVDHTESIEELEALAAMLDEGSSKCLLRSANLDSYQIGAVVFARPKADADEIELSHEPYNSSQQKQQAANKELEHMVRKRRMGLVDGGAASQAQTPQGEIPVSDVKGFGHSFQGHLFDHQTNATGSINTGMLPDSANRSATTMLLNNFMNIHTYKKRKLTSSTFFAQPAVAHIVAEPNQVPASPAQADRPEEATNPVAMVETNILAYSPLTNSPLPPTKVIKSLTLDRSIFVCLETRYPSLSIIERDFSKWNTSSWDKGAITRSPKVSKLAAEADLIISPAVGLVVTCLTKLMQKTPASASKVVGGGRSNSLRARVASVALRYEKLIVLVSERNVFGETSQMLTSSELEVIAEFAGYAAGLPNHVEVVFVSGGVETLVGWVITLIVKYAMPAVHNMLMQAESAWELFLRRAGMNAYAAQVIPGLASLLLSAEAATRMSGGASANMVTSSPCQLGGLAAFMRMSRAERGQNFRDVLGGEKVLHRVSEVLDAHWQ